MEFNYSVKVPGNSPQIFEDAYDAADYITNCDDYIYDLEVNADDMLDECYGKIEIAGSEFWASRILANLDDYLYDECKSEEQRNAAECNRDWIAEQIENLGDGEETDFEGSITVKAFMVYDNDDDADESYVSDDVFNSIFE